MTIAEVSKKYDLTPDTLRYYEKIDLIPKVRRTKGGIRDYGENDCNWVEYIKCMRSAGVSIETLVEYVALFREGEETMLQRKELLMRQREQIAQRIDEMNAVLKRLDLKIDGYEEKILKCEAHLK